MGRKVIIMQYIFDCCECPVLEEFDYCAYLDDLDYGGSCTDVVAVWIEVMCSKDCDQCDSILHDTCKKIKKGCD